MTKKEAQEMRDMFDDDRMKKLYGLRYMTFEEAVRAPEPVRRTRNNKVEAINKITLMKEYLDYLNDYIKRIPEENDEYHADLVDKVVKQIQDAHQVVTNILYH